VLVVIRAEFAGDEDRDLGYVWFERGDLFTERYWRDRWYSVKEVRDARGAVKGWYCDVTRPVVVSQAELVSADLDLDLWLSADGRTVLRLDEDEFAASGLAETDPEAAARALAALDELESAARSGRVELFGDLPGDGNP
jgi:predicted RNA-binding protein associated with RNAse of E/G family